MSRLFRPAALAAVSLVLGVGFAGGAGVASASTHAGASAVRSTDLVPGGPLIRPLLHGNEPYPTISLNWSGYAVTAGKGQAFQDVSASWTVPAIKCTGHYEVMSNWVGLDGYSNETVEQDGTAAYCGGGSAHNLPRYYAWIEMFPANTVNVFQVKPGDQINASVNYSGGKFNLTVQDTTSGHKHTTSAACSTCARASAEWIIERPASCHANGTHCYILRMADFGTTSMTNAWAQLSGGSLKTPGQFANNYPIDSVSIFRNGRPGFISVDETSALNGDNFSIQWNRAGTPIHITL